MLGKAIDIVALVSLLAGGAFFGIAIVPDTPRQTVVLPEYMVNGVDIDRIPTGKVWAATPVEVDSTSLDDIKALVGGGCLSIGAVIVLLARTLAADRKHRREHDVAQAEARADVLTDLYTNQQNQSN